MVPLGPGALRLIEAQRGQHAEFVFPAHRRDGPFGADVLANTARGVRTRLGMSAWTPHDLRRTVATGLARLGVDEFVIQRVLGHAYSSVTSIYNRYAYLKEKRAALELWEHHLLEVVGVGAARSEGVGAEEARARMH